MDRILRKTWHFSIWLSTIGFILWCLSLVTFVRWENALGGGLAFYGGSIEICDAKYDPTRAVEAGVRAGMGPSRPMWGLEWEETTTRNFVIVPLWWLWALPLAYTVFFYRKYGGRTNAMSSRRCTVCGYDLSGLPENAPCPECGASPSLRDRSSSEHRR